MMFSIKRKFSHLSFAHSVNIIMRNSRIANGHKYSNYIPPDLSLSSPARAPSGEGRGLRGTKIFAQKTSPQEGRTPGPHEVKNHVLWKNLTISAELYTLS